MHIPEPLRAKMADDPYYLQCARQIALDDHVCAPHPMTGQLIEWEHAFLYSSKQVNEKWAIVPICWWAHSGPGLKKDINQWLAINRAIPADFKKYPGKDWFGIKARLNAKYGTPKLLTESSPF